MEEKDCFALFIEHVTSFNKNFLNLESQDWDQIFIIISPNFTLKV